MCGAGLDPIYVHLVVLRPRQLWLLVVAGVCRAGAVALVEAPTLEGSEAGRSYDLIHGRFGIAIAADSPG